MNARAAAEGVGLLLGSALLAQLVGLVHLRALAVIEHAAFEWILVAGWIVHGWLGSWGWLGLVAVSVAWVWSRRPVADAMGLLLLAPALLFVAFGAALAPLAFGAGLLAALAPRGRGDAGLFAAAGGLVVVGFVASMLATPVTGTAWDALADGAAWLGLGRLALLVSVGLGWWARSWNWRELAAWALVAVGHGAAAAGDGWVATGASLGLGVAVGFLGVAGRRRGLPAWQLVARPARWPAGVGLALLASAGAVASSALRAPACPDADRQGVRRVLDVPAPFSVAPGPVAVHRERRWVQGPGWAVHVAPELGVPEEAFALPDGRTLVTGILDEPPWTQLLVVEQGRLRALDSPATCWVSALVWDEARGEVLLGCEERPDVFAFDPVSEQVSRRGSFGRPDDTEDFALLGRELATVSLAEGDRLRIVDADDLSLIAEPAVGGFSYAVGWASPQRLVATRFHDSSLVAYDRDGVVQGWRRVGFGVRPLVRLGDRWWTGSMFHGRLRSFRVGSLRPSASLRLGGRMKALAVDGDELLVGTACGVFAVRP